MVHGIRALELLLAHEDSCCTAIKLSWLLTLNDSAPRIKSVGVEEVMPFDPFIQVELTASFKNLFQQCLSL